MSGDDPVDPTSPEDDRNEADAEDDGWEWVGDHGDPMGPPKVPCECWCMHCERTFMSDQIWFQRVVGDPRGFKGFWMCPTPNCGGAGFTFDIFPTDPDHPANDGWYDDDDEDDNGADPEIAASDDDDDFDADEILFSSTTSERAAEDEPYDPDETRWKHLDEQFGGAGGADDDDLEGEEWKYGLAPGERPPEPDWMEEARREQEEEERRYDEPDRRPREVDWSDRPDRRVDPRPGGEWTEDDIPF